MEEKNFYDSLADKSSKLDELIIDDEDRVEEEESKKNLFDQLTNRNEKIIHKSEEENKKILRDKISTELASKTKGMKLFGTKDKKDIEKVESYIRDIIKTSDTVVSKTLQTELIDEMLLDITGYGRIHALMKDPTITEVMINAYDEVWIERKGRLIKTDIKYANDDEVFEFATRIATNVGRSINNSNPIVDARLPDGSRVAIIAQPISLKGTTITIRKFFEEKLTIDDLINFGSISKEAAKFLEEAVLSRANIIVSGGTGSGKTTTLNIISNFVPDHERILTLEDAAELQLNNEHVVRMESRDANAEGKGKIDIRALVKASLRHRPERIIVGEVRDGSAFDLLQAMNTGHDGSMATTHANSPDLCINRLDNLVLQAGLPLPAKFIRQTIAEAVDIIVQITKLSDGSRRITHISEVVEYDEKTERVITEPIYLYKKTGRDSEGKYVGNLSFTGHIVTEQLQNKFESHGLNYFESVGLPKPEEIFD